MSLRDPLETRAPRAVLAGLLGLVCWAAGAVFGWGTAFGGAPDNSPAADHHAIAFIAGLLVTVLASLASGFALPPHWRVVEIGLPILLAVYGVDALAMAGGNAVAAGFGPATAAFVVPAAACLAGAAYAVHRTAAGARLEHYLDQEGVRRPGSITSCRQTGSMNGAPRWAYVAAYTDAEGRPRWVTKHVTTFSPPGTGSPVEVTYDPHHPGSSHRIRVGR